MAIVPTVRGELDSADLGQTLMHEHVVTVTAEVARDYPDLSWTSDKEGVLQSVVAMLREVKARGIDTIVDCTAFGHGRDIDALQRINEQVDLNIIACTGIYTYDYLPFFFLYGHPVRQVDGRDVDILTEMFVRDVTEGIAGSGVKAGMIKTATDHAGVTPEHRADPAGRGQAPTGRPARRSPPTPPSPSGTGSTSSGSSPRRASTSGGSSSGTAGTRPTWTTCARSSTPARRSGPTASACTCRTWACRGWTSGCGTLAQLCAEGYSDRIVLSHDVTCYGDWIPRTGRVRCSTIGCRPM